ncbi:G-D-S-L family lipolytic protein [Mucilaginibacter glaciei]|uniref:G-D-S-L family lipolytic protein n=1 Tax=Mucilaginibacter glaciei TaxID=2772109 RepID=A0A926S1T5_9SPHI|nr:G-D-S-L family lipolytic protein [Mucilaginibacter glaciei]MBD1392484.1 G-D-S-L family lipolytic protein [Mucilaginibacter glaciei]
MKTLKQYLYISAALFVFAGCKPEIKTANKATSNADFSRYIAVGNSLTAGYADGGLYLEGQQNSYPSIIAKQMAAVGGGTFTQPLFNADQANGSGYLQLTGFTATGSPITTTVTANTAVRGQVTIPGFGNVTLYTKYTGDINNYGVPGIKLQQITFAPYGNLNGFFERMLPGNAGTNSTTYLDFVTAKPFTFFTDWLGNNDALGYATSGGAGDVLTDKGTFAALYNLSIGKLTASGQKGAVATIPDVTAIPYFNTVTVGAVLAAVKAANPAVANLYINARTTAADGTATYAARVATAADLIVLTFPTSKMGTPITTPAGTLPYGLTPLTPIENQYVLDANEITLTKDYVVNYNNTIKSIAAAKGLAVFDAYTFLNGVKQNGLVVDGVGVSSNYISGGLFSLDGVHLTPRGYAIVANEFIRSINKTYGSSIPSVNVADYNAVKFPAK